ncbi:hypothetical protein [Anabaena subtropica]|nr:hypothetical protein [Anabaena subtropica]
MTTTPKPENFIGADVNYGRRVAEGLGIAIDPSMMPKSPQAVEA